VEHKVSGGGEGVGGSGLALELGAETGETASCETGSGSVSSDGHGTFWLFRVATVGSGGGIMRVQKIRKIHA